MKSKMLLNQVSLVEAKQACNKFCISLSNVQKSKLKRFIPHYLK